MYSCIYRMSDNILKLDELVKGNTRFHYFPEYQQQTKEILNRLASAQTVDLDGTRKKEILSLSDGSQMIVLTERAEDDKYRSIHDNNVNYSQKEVLVARSLSELAEVSDNIGSIRFARPIGYVEEGEERKAIFFYENGVDSNSSEMDTSSRTFAYFVMLYNGVLHKEGAKDFIPIRRAGKTDLYVVDFEHVEFVQEQDINQQVNRVLTFDQVNPGIREQVSEDLRRFSREHTPEQINEILMINLNQNAPRLSERLRPYLTERGYFNGEVVLAPAYDTIMQVRDTISR